MADVIAKKKLTEGIKTFRDLQKEIIYSGKCVSCGACVAYCSSQGFDVLKMVGEVSQYISEDKAENCTDCGVCYYICPQTEPLQDKIKEIYKASGELGYVPDVYAAKTTDQKLHGISQDGGLVTTIITYLFDKKKIDGAVVSTYDETFKPIPAVIYSKADLHKSSGTRYSVSPNVMILKDINKIAEEIAQKNKQIYDLNQIRLAFVGSPCQIRAIRKMQLLNISPAHAVKYLIGLFCFENFEYDEMFKTIKVETNEAANNIIRTDIKKNFYITNKDNKVFEVPLNKFDEAVRSNCRVCDEYTARFADISCGGSGAVQKNSMIIPRTEKGQELLMDLFKEGYIKRYLPKKLTLDEWKTNKITLFKRMQTRKIDRFEGVK